MHFGVSGEWRPKWKEAHPMGEPHAVNVCATEGVAGGRIELGGSAGLWS